jgi:hypothetical protein
MYRWLLFLLLILNLGVFIWGWRTDGPDAPPPLAEARAEIRLLAELPPDLPAPSVRPDRPEARAVPAPIDEEVAHRRAAPVSAYDRAAVPPATTVGLRETTIERVDPGLMPDELVVEPPVVIPPVRDDDQRVMHTWSR